MDVHRKTINVEFVLFALHYRVQGAREGNKNVPVPVSLVDAIFDLKLLAIKTVLKSVSATVAINSCDFRFCVAHAPVPIDVWQIDRFRILQF